MTKSEINLPKAHSVVNPNRIDDKSNNSFTKGTMNYVCVDI